MGKIATEVAVDPMHPICLNCFKVEMSLMMSSPISCSMYPLRELRLILSNMDRWDTRANNLGSSLPAASSCLPMAISLEAAS